MTIPRAIACIRSRLARVEAELADADDVTPSAHGVPAQKRPLFSGDRTLAAGSASLYYMHPQLFEWNGELWNIRSKSTDINFAGGTVQVQRRTAPGTWGSATDLSLSPDQIEGVTPVWLMAHAVQIGSECWMVAYAATQPETGSDKGETYIFKSTSATLATWTRVAKITPGAGRNWLIGSTHIRVLPDGSWIFAAYYPITGTGSGGTNCRAYRSTDSGVTWTAHEVPTASGYALLGEPALSYRGSLLTMLIRCDTPERYLMSTSGDGMTWSAPTAFPALTGYDQTSNGPWGEWVDAEHYLCFGRITGSSTERAYVIRDEAITTYPLTTSSANYGGSVLYFGGQWHTVRASGATGSGVSLYHSTVTMVPDVLLDWRAYVRTSPERGRGLATTVNGGAYTAVDGQEVWRRTATTDDIQVGSAAADFLRMSNGSGTMWLAVRADIPVMTSSFTALLANNGTNGSNIGISLVVEPTFMRFLVGNGAGGTGLNVAPPQGLCSIIVCVEKSQVRIWVDAVLVGTLDTSAFVWSSSNPTSILTVGDYSGSGGTPIGLGLSRVLMFARPYWTGAEAEIHDELTR